MLRKDDGETPWSSRSRNLLRALAVAMGAVHTCVALLQQSMNEDGINYLDLGDAYLRGDWSAAINSTWSPAYAWLISATVNASSPSIWWEFRIVQMTNFAIYIFALLAFEFFWNRLTLRHFDANESLTFPRAGWHAIGYSLFIWSSLGLIAIWSVTPDMCVAAVAYLVAGMLLTVSREPVDLRYFALLGAALGIGYLVKAAMLPLGLVAILLAVVAAPGLPRRRLLSAVTALAALFIVAAPLIGAISLKHGQLTIGEVGRFTYLKHVNEMPYPDFLAAVDRLQGRPSNPPRRIFVEPPMYEFAEPIGGSYPMAYDPGYWTAGLKPVVSVGGQLRALLTNGMVLFEIFVRVQGPFLALVALFALMGRRGRIRLDGPCILVLWSIAAFGMYSLVHVLPRYIAPFVVLFWAGLLSGRRFPADVSGRRLALVGPWLLAAFVWVNIAALNLDGIRRVTGFTPLSEAAAQPAAEDGPVARDQAPHPDIANELLLMGLAPGDAIGYIGYSYTEYWVRLARLRIIAEIHWHDMRRFSEAAALTRAAVMNAFAATGAVAVVAQPDALVTVPEGWQEVGDTGYLLYMLRH